MAGLPKALVRAVAAVADTNVAVPASKRWIITNVILTNVTTANVSATIKLDGLAILASAVLGSQGIITLDCAQVLETGKNITYSAGIAASVNVHISGVEMDAV